MDMKETLETFLDFRCSVVARRARVKLSQWEDRRHIVEGIIVALDNSDRLSSILREASNEECAVDSLRNVFKLSEIQAEAILYMKLKDFSMAARKKFVTESKTLTEQIMDMEELLLSKKSIVQLMEQEAMELKNWSSSTRRSMLEDSDSGLLEDIDEIPNEEMLLALSGKGYIKRMKANTFNLHNCGAIGKCVGKLRVNYAVSDFIVCHSHDHVLYFSDRGIVYSAHAYKIPERSRNAAGIPLDQILYLSDGERITSIVPVSEFAEDQFLVMLTVKGYIKKVSLNSFSAIWSPGIIAIQLVPGDKLKWVRRCTIDDLVAMASHNGMVILSSSDIIPSLSRHTTGAVAMRLEKGDMMASMDIIPAAVQKAWEMGSGDSQSSGPWLLFVSESCYGKRVPWSSFQKSPFDRDGLRGYKFSSADGLAAVFVVGFSLADDGESDEQVALVSRSGTVNTINVRDIPIQSLYARGDILMHLQHAEKIQSAFLISATQLEPELLPGTKSPSELGDVSVGA